MLLKTFLGQVVFFSIALGIGLSVKRTIPPSVEVYWESYLGFPNNVESCKLKTRSNWIAQERIRRNVLDISFGLELTSIPDHGVDIINIAFADFNVDRCDRYLECNEILCGLSLFKRLDESVFEKLLEDIQQVRSRGVIVKLAFGGEQWGNIKVPTMTTHVADRVVDLIVDSAQRLGVDGVDLVQEEGCGYKNFRCHDQTSVHLYVIEKLSRKMAGKSISYTFPAGNQREINFPFNDVIRYGHPYLDSINIFGAITNKTIWQAFEAGVPREKIVWGLAIGCNKNPFLNVTLSEAELAATFVRDAGLKGISMWSVNRDTNHRVGSTSNICTTQQTGLSDGSYIKAINNILH